MREGFWDRGTLRSAFKSNEESINLHILQGKQMITAKRLSSHSYWVKEMKFKGRTLDLATPILFDAGASTFLTVKWLFGNYGTLPLTALPTPVIKQNPRRSRGKGVLQSVRQQWQRAEARAVTSEPIKCIRCHRYLLYPSHFGPHRLIRRGKRYNPEVKLLHDYNPDSLPLMSFPADMERGECFDLQGQEAERTTVWSKAVWWGPVFQ